MSDNITVTVQLAGGINAAQTFDLESATDVPSPPPESDESTDAQINVNDSPPPPEEGGLDDDDNQDDSSNAQPPEVNNDAEAQDDDNDEPLPPEV